MRPRLLFLLGLLSFALAGCMALPRIFNPFPSPIEKFDKKEQKETDAQNKVLDQAQEAVHKAEAAANAGVPSRAKDVSLDFLRQAKALLDQVRGTPTAAQVAAWSDLVARLLSENAEIRAKAEADRQADAVKVAEIADKLAAATAEREKAAAKIREYALENEKLADLVRKIYWIGGSLAGLWLIGQGLALVARFNPAFGAASAVVNSVAAPAVQYVYTRAQTGLVKVGEGMAALRHQLPEVADKVRVIMNQATDSDHQEVIGQVAESTLKEFRETKS